MLFPIYCRWMEHTPGRVDLSEADVTRLGPRLSGSTTRSIPPDKRTPERAVVVRG